MHTTATTPWVAPYRLELCTQVPDECMQLHNSCSKPSVLCNLGPPYQTPCTTLPNALCNPLTCQLCPEQPYQMPYSNLACAHSTLCNLPNALCKPSTCPLRPVQTYQMPYLPCTTLSIALCHQPYQIALPPRAQGSPFLYVLGSVYA